jgi:hypothetical protein
MRMRAVLALPTAPRGCGAQCAPGFEPSRRESLGKRLYREAEWNFACEGEAMLPYPTGLERDHTH